MKRLAEILNPFVVCGTPVNLAILLAFAVFSAQARPVTTFRLETAQRSDAYGPFEFIEGGRIVLEESVYRVETPDSRTVSFRSYANRSLYGPYEFAEGRMIEIGNEFYTIVGIRTVEVADSASAPNRATIEPTAGSYSFWNSTEFGVAFAPYDATIYDIDIQDSSSLDKTAIERASLTAFMKQRYWRLDLGFSTDGELDGSAAGPFGTYDDATFNNGQGWQTKLTGTAILLNRDGWRFDLTASGGYRYDDLTIAYDGWTTTESLIVAGTNGSPAQVITTRSRTRYTEDLVLHEWTIGAGIRLAYTSPSWSFYASLDATPLSGVETSGNVEINEAGYDIDIERSHPIGGTMGIAYRISRVNLFVEGDLGANETIRAGISILPLGE